MLRKFQFGSAREKKKVNALKLYSAAVLKCAVAVLKCAVAVKIAAKIATKIAKSKNRLFRSAIFIVFCWSFSCTKCFQKSNSAPRAKKKKVNALKLYSAAVLKCTVAVLKCTMAVPKTFTDFTEMCSGRKNCNKNCKNCNKNNNICFFYIMSLHNWL